MMPSSEMLPEERSASSWSTLRNRRSQIVEEVPEPPLSVAPPRPQRRRVGSSRPRLDNLYEA